MARQSWIRRLFAPRTATISAVRKPGGQRTTLRVEQFEDRVVPTVMFSDGTTTANFAGFDPAPGNVLNVNITSAVNAFIHNPYYDPATGNLKPGGNPNDPAFAFTAYGQSNVAALITPTGTIPLPGGYTFVFAIPERITQVIGPVGGASSKAQFIFDTSAGPSAPNYFQFYKMGGTGGSDLNGTGFNGTKSQEVLSGHFTGEILSTPGTYLTSANTTSQDLDQFNGNSYPGNFTLGGSGNIALVGVTSGRPDDYVNPSYFTGGPLGTAKISSQLQLPFNSVNPSGEFLTNTTTTAVVPSPYAPSNSDPVKAGAGLGTATTGLGIGPVNGNGDANNLQVQQDANLSFGSGPQIDFIKLTNGTNNDTDPSSFNGPPGPVAGTPVGPIVEVGSPVTWTYEAQNTGDESIQNVAVTDSVSGVTPAPVLVTFNSQQYNTGDTNHNNLLDPGETWLYTASGTAQLGQYSNVGTVTGTSTLTNKQLTVTNPDHYFGVDANISITPPSPVNVVGNAETFTITVHALPGSTPGTTIAAPTVSFVGGSPVSVGPVTLMSNDGSTAVYTVTINNPTAGKFEIKASDNITFTSPYSPLPGSLTLTRATGDGHTGDSADAVKTYQDIAVSITPSATDVVGHQHTFTAHVGINLGDGAGFVNDPNATVTVALTPSNGASVHQDSPTNGVVGGGGAVTYTLTTDANGNATVTFDSPTAGKVTGHASSTLDLGAGGSVTRTTGDGYTTTGGSDSANAVKTYVDAYISITPSATNPINAPHTFTVSVFTNNGDGTGYHQVQDSTAVTETLTAAGGASITQLNPGSGTGLASATYNLTTTSAFSPGVTFTSPTVGTVTGHASTTITVLGVPLTRATNDGVSLDSPDAVKTFANPRIALVKLTNGTNNDGAPVAGTPDGPLVPFGSTVTWTYNVSNTGTEPIANVKVTDSVSGVTPATVFGDGAPGHGNATHNIGDANNNNLLDLTETWVFTASGAAVLGQYSNVGTATGTSTVTSTPVSATNPDHYFGVDAFISITPQQATNPVGTAHTFTITVTALPGTIALNAANVSFATPTITYPGLTPDLAHPATATFVSRTGNVATYSLTINSSQAGTFEVKASDTVTFSSASSPNTLPLTRTTGDGYTDANGSDSLDAFKTYTNGNIKLAGLTLGFWKNHTDQWKTTDSNGNVISIPVSIKLIDAFPDAANAAGGVYKTETLLTALQTGGGGLNALFRQAAAAYLNSQHPLVGYPISTADLQRVVYDAVKLNKFGTQIDDLQTLLNNLNGIEVGIDAHGNPTGGNPTLSKAQVNAQITAYNNKYYSPPSSGIPLLP